MTAVAGLLHTVPSLAQEFDERLGALRPTLRRVHVVDHWLLATAIASGVDDDVRHVVAEHARHLERAGATAILVTCSSIGEAAEAARSHVDIPVLRVDEAMAEEAVRIAGEAAGRIAVLATLASTLGPTERLVRRVADGTHPGMELSIAATVVDGADAARAAGDTKTASRLIAAAVQAAAQRADVVVLAQASMAAAAAGVETATPVLTSPASGVDRLLRTIERTIDE